MLATDRAVQEAIAAAFGEQVRLADGRIDRAALGGIVFADPAALALLESDRPSGRARAAGGAGCRQSRAGDHD